MNARELVQRITAVLEADHQMHTELERLTRIADADGGVRAYITVNTYQQHILETAYSHMVALLEEARLVLTEDAAGGA